MQNLHRFKTAYPQKLQNLWFGFGLVFVLFYGGYHANLTQTTFESSEKCLIKDNFSLEHPNIRRFFSDSKTLFYHKEKTIYRPLFAFGLSLDHQLKNPWIFRFHSWMVFIGCFVVLFYFPLQPNTTSSIRQHRRYRLLTLLLLVILPSTASVLGNVAHRAELSATMFLLMGFSLLSKNEAWMSLTAIPFLVCAGLTHEAAWAFLLPLCFYRYRRSFDETFGFIWSISFSLSAFWLSPSNSPFAVTGFMMSIGLYFMLQSLVQNLLHRPKLGKPFWSKKHISILVGLLLAVLFNLKHRNLPESKSTVQEDYDIGIELISAHQWKEALNHFERLHHIVPYHHPTVLKLLETYHTLEYWEKLEHLSSQIAKNGLLLKVAQGYQTIAASKKSRMVLLEENFAAHPTVQNALLLASESYRTGAYAQSAHFSRWILQFEPNSEEALNQLGQAYLKLGNRHDAKRAFQRANGAVHSEHFILAAMR